MRDIQTTFLRQTAKVDSLDFVTTIIERNYADAGSVTAVKVNGQGVGFGLIDSATLNYALPPGAAIESVSSIIYEKGTVDNAGTSTVISDDRPTPDPTFLSAPHLLADIDIFFDISSILIKTSDTADSQEVLLNGGSSPFFVLDANHVVAALPDALVELTSVDVIVGSAVQTERTFHVHKLDLSSTVSGGDKLLGQFNKLLLTTTGTDMFQKDIGGDFQKWVGMKHSLANKTSAVMRANINILRTATLMQLTQMSRGVPQSETIATAQVLDYTVDLMDPSQGEVSLRIVTMAGIAQIFNTQIEKAKSLVAGAVSNVESNTGVDLSAKSDIS